MRRYQFFSVAPRIPGELNFLETLANNLWWSWNDDAIAIFRRISPRIFTQENGNPLRLLARLDQHRFESLAEDPAFLTQLDQVREKFQREVLTSKHWAEFGEPFKCIAYFSLEFGLNENVRLYSGGLGILAGDHLKSASDLDLPVAGVGLLYREGYFQQTIDMHGTQKESYPENLVHTMPLSLVSGENGHPLKISVPLPQGEMFANVWRLNVGRVPLFLLDTNVQSNPPELRNVTGRLYGGDRLNRLRQELLLGIGGYSALSAMGYEPAVCHMNEGHAAFLGLARINHLCHNLGVDMDTAYEIVRRTNVFTTHTPVPAGNETFPLDLLRDHLKKIEDTGCLPAEKVIEWGRAPGQTGEQDLSMTILGLNLSKHNNGVSRLHGEVERRMWRHLWPEIPEDEVPIRHITNGVHVSTWLSPELSSLYENYLGPDWQRRIGTQKILHRIDQIPDEELWRAHEKTRSQLVRVVREYVENRLRERNAPRNEIGAARSALDSDALTIGFARRFTAYKRANLILRDTERLVRLLTDNERPVQIIFAGKAHPEDHEGKEIVKEIVAFARRKDLLHRVVFLEDYDMYVARHLAWGVDVWLNTPRRPHEASGTSGMKICINGGLHFSVLDGWWSEGYSPDCGWAIGNGEEYQDNEYQDTVESQALHNILENDIVNGFYDRSSGDIPTRWIAKMKASIRMSLDRFTSHRMVRDYDRKVYHDAFRLYDEMLTEDCRLAREFVAHHNKIREAWPRLRISSPETDRPVSDLHVGDRFKVSAKVYLANSLAPEDVDVEIYFGPLDAEGQVKVSHSKKMKVAEQLDEATYLFREEVVCGETGRFGFTTRITPRGQEWSGIMPGYILWANGNHNGDAPSPDPQTPSPNSSPTEEHHAP